MTAVAVHPDAESMEFHKKVAGRAFRNFTEFIKLSTVEVYGKPSDVLLEQLRWKTRVLGGGTGEGTNGSPGSPGLRPGESK
jgi:hypothetical protein